MMKSMGDMIKEVVEGNIGAISIDTNIFDGAHLRLEYGLLKRIEQFCDTDIKFILSDVVYRELLSHLESESIKAESELRKALRSVENPWIISRENQDKIVSDMLKGRISKDVAKQRLENYVEKTECEIADAEVFVNVGELTKRYFEVLPPFEDKESKKFEFPDAMALLSLEGWAEKNNTKVLVVSNDGGWVKYCLTSNRLIVVRSLSDAFSIFHRDSNFACATISRQFLSGDLKNLKTAIDEKIQSHLESIDFIPDADSDFYFESELGEINLIEYDLEPIGRKSIVFTPVDADEDRLVISAKVIAKISVDSEFYYSVRDSIDKDYVPMGSSSETMTVNVDIDLIVTIAGNQIPNEFEVEDIEASSGNVHVMYGYVEPIWRNEPDDYEDNWDDDGEGRFEF